MDGLDLRPTGRPLLRRVGWALGVLGVWLCVQASAAGASTPDWMYIFDIATVGSVPGVDYDPLVLSDPTDLSSIHFLAEVDTGWPCDTSIATLPTGKRYTLISSTGGLTGVLKGANDRNPLPEGTVIQLYDGGHVCGAPTSRRSSSSTTTRRGRSRR